MLFAYCLQPQDAYGLEKLASEELAKHYDTDFGIECRIARYMLSFCKSLVIMLCVQS
jgi:nucleoside-diphosphate-sugar epimerase